MWDIKMSFLTNIQQYFENGTRWRLINSRYIRIKKYNVYTQAYTRTDSDAIVS